jgi:hypothetical protein
MRVLLMVLVMTSGLVATGGVFAQDSVDAILEKARGQAREIEKLKRVLNEEPDPNVRLAAFDLMVQDGDSTMHAIAVDAGLASADRLLQAAAFREAIMSLDRLHLTLSVDTSAAQEMQEKARAYLDKNGNTLVLVFKKKDRKAGTFSNANLSGEVTGTLVTYKHGHGSGTLELKDDNAVSGNVTVYSSGYMQFLASGRIR